MLMPANTSIFDCFDFIWMQAVAHTHTDSRKISTPDVLAAVARLLHGWMK